MIAVYLWHRCLTVTSSSNGDCDAQERETYEYDGSGPRAHDSSYTRDGCGRRRPLQADGWACGGFQLCGSSSSIRDAGCVRTRRRTSAR